MFLGMSIIVVETIWELIIFDKLCPVGGAPKVPALDLYFFERFITSRAQYVRSLMHPMTPLTQKSTGNGLGLHQTSHF
jgi:hypothetical protein